MAAIKTVEVRAEARVPRIEVSGGLPGSPGIPGNDGISVTGASIDGSGHLILSFSSGPDVDVGLVVGTNGTDGTDGVDGISITGASIDGSGHLILTFSSGPPVDVGDVTGTDGTNGADGVSIIGASVDGSYHLILTLSDSSTIDAGYVRGPAGSGTGDVVGPAGATNGNLASYNGTTGKLIGEIAPAALPISTATQTALNALDTGKLNISALDATLAAKSTASAAIASVLTVDGAGDVKRLVVPLSPDVSSTGRFGIQSAGGIFLHENYASEPSNKVGMALRTQTDITYTGGTPGFVVSGHRNSMTVSAGIADFCWAGLDVLNNYATAGENVARYMQANKRSTGPTWAGCFELRDYDDTNGGAPVIEVGLFGNGSVNALNRVGVDVIFQKNDALGSALVVGYGVRVQPVAGEATVTYGYYAGGAITHVMQIAGSGTTGIRFDAAASYVIGTNYSLATFSSAPIRMAADQKIQLEATGAITFGYEATGTKFAFKNGATERLAVSTATGALSINGLQVLSARKTGWGTPSGTLSRAAYAAYAGQNASAVYVEAEAQATDDAVKLMSQTLAALLTDIHSGTSGQGFIGT